MDVPGNSPDQLCRINVRKTSIGASSDNADFSNEIPLNRYQLSVFHKIRQSDRRFFHSLNRVVKGSRNERSQNSHSWDLTDTGELLVCLVRFNGDFRRITGRGAEAKKTTRMTLSARLQGSGDLISRTSSLKSPNVSFRHISAWRDAERLPKHGHEARRALVTEVGGNLLN